MKHIDDVDFYLMDVVWVAHMEAINMKLKKNWH